MYLYVRFFFAAHDVYHHKMSLIPDLVVSKVFALVALIIKDGKVEGKVILQPKCVDSDLSKQMKNLFSVLNKVRRFLNNNETSKSTPHCISSLKILLTFVSKTQSFLPPFAHEPFEIS